MPRASTDLISIDIVPNSVPSAGSQSKLLNEIGGVDQISELAAEIEPIEFPIEQEARGLEGSHGSESGRLCIFQPNKLNGVGCE